MSLLFNLPSNILSYIYSFDDTYQEQMKSELFRFEILLRSGAAKKLIDQYIQELFQDNMVWYNTYGTFGLSVNKNRLRATNFYSQYKLLIVHDSTINFIYFKIQPLHIEERQIDFIRYDGFLTLNEEVEDDTYIGTETYQQGGRVHLYVDDL